MTLVLVIALTGAWLLVGLLVCLALCASAARGDRGLAGASLLPAGGRRRFERDFESAV